ncbi:MAG: O-antigen ligase family protein [Chloroflexi bacterium]|nr:O-antigen ligase family protein [Chloroflexota bacterium]
MTGHSFWQRLLALLPQGDGARQGGLAVGLVAAPALLYYLSPNLLLAFFWTAVFLFMAWWRLDLGLLVVLLSAPFYRFPKALDLAFLTTPLGRTVPLDISLAEYALWVCAVAWCLRRLAPAPEVTSQLDTSLPRATWDIWAPPALLVGAATVSLLFTQHLQVALREYRVVVVEPALYYLLLVQTLRGKRDVARYLAGLVVLAAAISLFGLFHYFAIGEVEATGGVRRILAVYHSPNALALFLGRAIPVALALALVPLLTGRRRRSAFLYGAAAAPMLSAFSLTFSRGAYLGLLAALLFLLAAVRRRLGLAVLVAGALTLLLAAPFLPWERLLAPTPIAQRLYVWQAALALALDHPLTGVGLDNFLSYYPRYLLPQAALEPDISHPHNLLLDFWLSLGILGLVALTGLLYHFGNAARRLLALPLSSSERTLALAVTASMVDALVHGLSDNSYFLIDLAYLFWMTYALLQVLLRQATSGPTVEAARP